MMELLSDLNIMGFLVGLFSFIVIGVFHPIVKVVEYRLGKKAWPFFLIPGFILGVSSIFFKNNFVSVIAGVLAFSLFWSTHEIFKQHERVLRGQAERNPDREYE
ncbi:MAG: DUF4491 family protein [Candidatus Krumholzibacteriales bacterium]